MKRRHSSSMPGFSQMMDIPQYKVVEDVNAMILRMISMVLGSAQVSCSVGQNENWVSISDQWRSSAAEDESEKLIS